MKAVLFYDAGEEYESEIRVEEFESKEQMIYFVNEERIGNSIIAAYEYFRKIEIEPYEKIVSYKLK